MPPENPPHPAQPPERSAAPPSEHTAPARTRIAALDVLRGFALCGILPANIQPIAGGGDIVTGRAWLDLFVHHRFFPIFSLLFGVGFALLMESASARGAAPRRLLLRRLLTLLAIGLAHYVLLWQGEILTVYALIGLLILLPSTWLPRWAVAGLAAAFLVTSLLAGGFYAMVPALFLLGSALVRYGVIDRIGRSARGPALLAAAFAAGAAPVLWMQAYGDGLDPRIVRLASVVAGLLLAGLYACLVLALLNTPLQRAVRAVFAPLGRMALTNYLTATLLVLAAGHLVGGVPRTWPSETVILIAVAVLALQWLWSGLWLRRHHYGPVEWLWRWATWARRPPLRRTHWAGDATTPIP
ncbi:DUF418 domain-containing protein [Nonomuraea candida]|uniref:DUF418 domain-containing protein n=1 Tax=Nonomuraea candida TaxID=359159 RepID=UPI0006931F48|nr:DUF418 domain-containing protein [Nonomuraea candida]